MSENRDKEACVGIAIDTEEKYEWLMKLLGLPVVKKSERD